MFKIKVLEPWFFVIALSFVTNAVFAEDRYQIEILIFAQDMPNTELFEQTQSEIEWPDQVLELQSLNVVPANKRMLNASFSDLTRNAHYQPILHEAWIQTISPEGITYAVRIQSDRRDLDGFIQLSYEQDLQLVVDLEFQPESFRFFHLQENRPIRINEEHYFDHPKFGVIAKIRPI